MEPSILIEEVKARIELEGVKYTARTWQMLQANQIRLTPDEAKAYELIQKAHYEFTGYSLPPIKGANMTRAQVRDTESPLIKEEVLDKAIQGGLAARLKQLRGE